MYNKNKFILLQIFHFLYYKIVDAIQWKAFCQNGDEFQCFIKATNFLTK